MTTSHRILTVESIESLPYIPVPHCPLCDPLLSIYCYVILIQPPSSDMLRCSDEL